MVLQSCSFIGDIDDAEDDGFRPTFSTASVFAAGFFLVDNTDDFDKDGLGEAGESCPFNPWDVGGS